MVHLDVNLGYGLCNKLMLHYQNASTMPLWLSHRYKMALFLSQLKQKNYKKGQMVGIISYSCPMMGVQYHTPTLIFWFKDVL